MNKGQEEELVNIIAKCKKALSAETTIKQSYRG